MAIYDMTLGATLGGETADTTADLPDVRRHAYMVEAILDISAIDTNEDNTEGKLRVFAVVCHVDGVAETADEVVRDQLA